MRSLQLLLISAAAMLLNAQPTVKGPLGEQPVATMNGKVVSVTSKIASVKMDDDNLLDFHLTRKTRYYANGKKADAKILKPGEAVTMEAIRAPDGSLDAVNVRTGFAKEQSK